MPECSPYVLVVEDEPALAQAIREHLTSVGFVVELAGTITEARQVTAERDPDLVVLDVLLPDGSGYDFCAELRRTTPAAIIYTSALGQDNAVVRGLDAGGDDYLAKPFSLEVLTARINAQLRRRSRATVLRLDLPPLHMDLVSGSVVLSGREVELSQRELQLLAFLAGHIGQGFTEAELLAAVWNDTSGLPTNTVRQHISRLRRKLRLDDQAAFEITRNAQRYRLSQMQFTPVPDTSVTGVEPLSPHRV